MKTLTTSFALVGLILASCAAPKTYYFFSDWDTNRTGSFERLEFIKAYTDLDYFRKWSAGKRSVSYSELQGRIFSTLDYDKDLQLNRTEFDEKITPFFAGVFSDRFESWDDDHDGLVSRPEYNLHIMTSKLSAIWDTDNDRMISEREVAGGMFYVCDLNGDTRVSNLEFEIWRVNR